MLTTGFVSLSATVSIDAANRHRVSPEFTSGHDIAYRWRSLRSVRWYRTSGHHQGSSRSGCCLFRSTTGFFFLSVMVSIDAVNLHRVSPEFMSGHVIAYRWRSLRRLRRYRASGHHLDSSSSGCCLFRSQYGPNFVRLSFLTSTFGTTVDMCDTESIGGLSIALVRSRCSWVSIQILHVGIYVLYAPVAQR